MKTKLFSILVVILLAFSFSACNEEEVTPSTDQLKTDGDGEVFADPF